MAVRMNDESQLSLLDSRLGAVYMIPPTRDSMKCGVFWAIEYVFSVNIVSTKLGTRYRSYVVEEDD
jgi:hypothetical protein